MTSELQDRVVDEAVEIERITGELIVNEGALSRALRGNKTESVAAYASRLRTGAEMLADYAEIIRKAARESD